MSPSGAAEHIAAGRYFAAPQTGAGRSRRFRLDDVLNLRLFVMLMDIGLRADLAGGMVIGIWQCIEANPTARLIALHHYPWGGRAYPADTHPSVSDWDALVTSGAPPHMVSTIDVGSIRDWVSAQMEIMRRLCAAPP